jgi:hypothetical protein
MNRGSNVPSVSVPLIVDGEGGGRGSERKKKLENPHFTKALSAWKELLPFGLEGLGQNNVWLTDI